MPNGVHPNALVAKGRDGDGKTEWAVAKRDSTVDAKRVNSLCIDI